MYHSKITPQPPQYLCLDEINIVYQTVFVVLSFFFNNEGLEILQQMFSCSSENKIIGN